MSLHLLGLSIADLQWKMRIKHQKTLEHYLQEVVASTSLRDIDPASRTLIMDMAALYEPYLLSCTAARPLGAKRPLILADLTVLCSDARVARSRPPPAPPH